MTERKAAIQRESAADRQHEVEIIGAVKVEWLVDAEKLPKKYSMDFALTRNNQVIAYAEVKDRPTWNNYTSYMLSQYKYERALQTADRFGRPVYFVARLGGDIMWTCLSELPVDVMENTQIGGWANPRDSDDIEPVVFIPISYFRALKDSGGTKLPSLKLGVAK